MAEKEFTKEDIEYLREIVRCNHLNFGNNDYVYFYNCGGCVAIWFKIKDICPIKFYALYPNHFKNVDCDKCYTKQELDAYDE